MRNGRGYFYNVDLDKLRSKLDKYNIIPTFFQKSWGFYIIRTVSIGTDCILNFTFYIVLLLKKYKYF